MQPKLPPLLEPRRLTAFDGTELAYYATRAPRPDAPTVVLANGLGGHFTAWRAQVDYLADRYRFLTWDYRGLYGSKRPPVDEQASYAVPHHVRDLESILAAEGVTRAALVGWSMGVQVVLETLRRRADLATCAVLINGTSGRPYDTLTPLPGMGAVVPSIVAVVRRVHQLATQMTRKATGQPEALLFMKRLGLIGKTLDEDVFGELVHSFGELDMEPFLRNLQAIGEHDATDFLPRVPVPTLIITGDSDAFTPRALSQKMARAIPRSEVLIIRGGTHYTCIEYPELVSLRIERFFREQSF